MNTSVEGFAASTPRVASCDGSVYAAWRDNRESAGDIHFNYSPDGGATWNVSDVRLGTGGAGVDPRITCCGATVYVTWKDQRANHDI